MALRRRPQKARIHTGGVPRLQHWGLMPRRAPFASNFRVPAMRYIERILQPGETLVYAGKIHWIVYFPAAILFAIALALLSRANSTPTGLSWTFGAAAFALAGATAALSAWFRRWTTEIDVTNRRIVYKRGVMSTKEVPPEEPRSTPEASQPNPKGK